MLYIIIHIINCNLNWPLYTLFLRKKSIKNTESWPKTLDEAIKKPAGGSFSKFPRPYRRCWNDNGESEFRCWTPGVGLTKKIDFLISWFFIESKIQFSSTLQQWTKHTIFPIQSFFKSQFLPNFDYKVKLS